MATVNGLTAERMLAIEAASVVDGDVVGDNLLLTRHDGSTINAGSVRGPQGNPGTNGTNGINANAGTHWNNSVTYAVNDTAAFAGRTWVSKAGSNLDKCPPFNLDYWTPQGAIDVEGWAQSDPFFSGNNLDNWELFWRGGTVTASLTSTAGEFETGFQAAKFVLGVSSTQRLYEREEEIIRGDETITIEIRAKLTAAAAGAMINGSLMQAPPNGSPQPFGSGAGETAAREPAQALTTSWQTYTFTVAAVNAKPRCRPNIIVYTGAGAGATVILDWVRVSRNMKRRLFVSRQTNRAQDVISGGGVRKVSATGVSWGQRLITMGLGMGAITPQGFFDIGMPADGTVIPVYGHSTTTSVTVASGTIPLSNWQVLYYDLPFGSGSNTDPTRFRIVDYAVTLNFQIPDTWIFIVGRNLDTDSPSHKWGDGRQQDVWRALTLQNSWVAYGSSWNAPRWRFRDDGSILLQGLMKNGTAGVAAFTFPTNLAPEGAAGTGLIFNQAANGGNARVDVHGDGTVVVMSYTSPATNAFVSLDAMTWFPTGV